MSTASLRERIARGLFDDGGSGDGAWDAAADVIRESYLMIADVMVAQTVEWLAGRKLRIVPEEVADGVPWVAWNAVLEAAPSNASALAMEDSHDGR
jgi:hypothetical protein